MVANNIHIWIHVYMYNSRLFRVDERTPTRISEFYNYKTSFRGSFGEMISLLKASLNQTLLSQTQKLISVADKRPARAERADFTLRRRRFHIGIFTYKTPSTRCELGYRFITPYRSPHNNDRSPFRAGPTRIRTFLMQQMGLIRIRMRCNGTDVCCAKK